MADDRDREVRPVSVGGHRFVTRLTAPGTGESFEREPGKSTFGVFVQPQRFACLLDAAKEDRPRDPEPAGGS
jgi:hypothetical protein